MNVSLPEELKEYVEAQTKSGYCTPSEYVRDLIRGDRKLRAKEKPDALLLAGLNSGTPIPVDAKFWSDLKQEALAKLDLAERYIAAVDATSLQLADHPHSGLAYDSRCPKIRGGRPCIAGTVAAAI
ncbi:MAG: hypothetical protein EXQ52_10395 [Bryobacterales bacterium]|nr:hypothetical protein [Bryobacterales bacterium]